MLFLLLACASPEDSAVQTEPPPPSADLNCIYSVDFGVIALGSSRFQDVTVSSIGEEPLEIGELRLAQEGGDFHLSPIGSILVPPGQSTTFTITYTPTATGAIEDQVLVESNDPEEPLHRVHLTGEGT